MKQQVFDVSGGLVRRSSFGVARPHRTLRNLLKRSSVVIGVLLSNTAFAQHWSPHLAGESNSVDRTASARKAASPGPQPVSTTATHQRAERVHAASRAPGNARAISLP